MQTYEICVEGRSVRANSADRTLVRTSVGIDRLHVLFDSEEWLTFPVTITFAQGANVVSLDLPLSEVDDSQWVAEGSCTIPHEVIGMVGPIRITLQGTDQEGNHIITSKASPLSVEEAGDVVMGDIPEDAPTVSQWQQAYAQAIEAAVNARSLVENLESRLVDMVAEARAEIGDAYVLPPASKNALGGIVVGDGMTVTEEGRVSVVQPSGITTEQSNALTNLSMLAYYGFDTEFDETTGLLKDTVKAKSSILPIADNDTVGMVYPDGTTITIDDDGMLHGEYITHSWDGSKLTITSLMGETKSVDLIGPQGPAGESTHIAQVTATSDNTSGTPSVTVTEGGTDSARTYAFAFSGLKGEKGDTGAQGPSGYVLTQQDIDTISANIIASYPLFDDGEF